MREAAFGVALMHGCGCSARDVEHSLPVGHGLSRVRLRHLRGCEWIVVSNATAPVGFAAYKRAESEVRVVHELVLDPTLPPWAAVTVTDLLVSALELLALEEGVTCLTFLLHNGVVIEPFEARGYMFMVLDDACVWLQRKLTRPGWSRPAVHQ